MGSVWKFASKSKLIFSYCQNYICFNLSYMDICKELMDETFTNIFCSTLTQLGDSLIKKIEDILSVASACEQGSLKYIYL